VVHEPGLVVDSSPTQFGQMGLLLADSPTSFIFRHPKTSEQALVDGAEKTWKFLDMDDNAGEVMASIVVSGIGGLLTALFTGVPEREIEAAEKRMLRELSQNTLLCSISNRLQTLLEIRGSPALVLVPSELATNLAGQTNRDYSVLNALGIDSVMELAIQHQGFQARHNGNPPMTLEAAIALHITRVSDGTLLFSRSLRYRGHQHRFTGWADENGKKFRSELNRAGRIIASNILDEILSRQRHPTQASVP
jgi:hypothetical protein